MNNMYFYWITQVIIGNVVFFTPCTSERVLLYSDSGNHLTVYGSKSWAWLNTEEKKVWETCSCSKRHCWNPQKHLLTSKINVSMANRVYISIYYSTRKCNFSTPCNEHLGIYVRRDKTFDMSREQEKGKYTFVANTSKKIDYSKAEHLHFETSALTDGFKYIFFGFLDSGYCGTLIMANISYARCPSKSSSLLKFDSRAAPGTGTSIVTGKCADNAIQEGSLAPEMSCSVNGSATFKGSCVCIAGYRKAKYTCQACPQGYFKEKKGNHICRRCGINSIQSGKYTRCLCKKGFYRAIAHLSQSEKDCYRPPDKPRELEFKNVTSNSAVLRWKEPLNIGTGPYTHYRVECTTCFSKKIYADDLNETTLHLKLASYAVYNFTVTSVNNITKLIGVTLGDSVSFRTLPGVPQEVRNLKWTINSDGSVTLSWEKPFGIGSPNVVYIVRYGSNEKTTSDTTFRVKKVTTKVTYVFTVFAKTSAGRSPPVKTPPLTMEGGIALELALGISAPLLFLLVIAIAIALYCWRRRHTDHEVRYENGGVTISSRRKGQKVYVDPMTYQDLTEAVTGIANQLNKSWLELENIIGGGEFGDVYKGTLIKPSENGRQVAIKILRVGANKQAKDDFLSEAAIMGQFDDPHVIILEGVVVKENPMMIVTEFMSNGSLDSFLQSNDGKFTALQLLGMARGVSSGMTYLSEMGFIHRDLAARNILVDKNLKCKVADFGMSRELKLDDTYDTRGGKIPVRWTAPEVIQYKKFTTSSDVWSYGILVWEVMSYGERPYWDWGNLEVLERIGGGYRLPPPMSCPKVIHDLMLRCWQKDRFKRPKFRNIRDIIDKWIRSPDLLNQEESFVVKRDEHLNYASMKTIKEWLDSIKMGQYTKLFIDGGFVTPRQLLTLNEQEIADLGVNVIGHRRKIFKSIQTTKRQVEHPPLLERTESLRI